jgi:hypothetical protein
VTVDSEKSTTQKAGDSATSTATDVKKEGQTMYDSAVEMASNAAKMVSDAASGELTPVLDLRANTKTRRRRC